MSKKKLLAIGASLTAIAALGTLGFLASRTVSAAIHPARGTVAAVCPCMARVDCSDVNVGGQSGWYFEPQQKNGGAILMLHGIGATREDMIPLSTVFLKAGYAILAPDLPGSGRSTGTVTYGREEAKAAATWAEWLRHQPNVQKIYGFGVSLGGTSLLESLDYEKNFRAVVAESSFADFPTVAIERTRKTSSSFTRWAITPFVRFCLLWSRLIDKEDLSEGSAVASIRRSTTPALIIHGLEDRATIPEHSLRIAAANPQTTELWLIPKAAHANGWATAGKEFESRVLSWYGRH